MINLSSCWEFHSVSITIKLVSEDASKKGWGWGEGCGGVCACGGGVMFEHFKVYMKEGSVLFNDALNTIYLRLYGVRHNLW